VEENKGMEFRSRTNQPQPAARPSQTVAPRPSFEGNDNMEHNNTRPMAYKDESSKKLWIVAAVAAAALIVLLLAGMYAQRMLFSTESAVQGGKYQAIFLTNGQVYFGHVSGVDNQYVKLANIYYLQVQQQVQPTDNKNNNNQQPQVSLTKLGSELHGPQDTMYISRQQVLFWENLKDDGKVVQAINQSQKK
jgi:hypothetical protein